MGRTKLGGNRIAEKSITTNHLSEDLRIPEKMLILDYPTHNHHNKNALDALSNTNPDLVGTLDLKDIVLTIMEIVDAKDQGVTLKSTLDNKASKVDVEGLTTEVSTARGNYASLAEALRITIIDAQRVIDSHAGGIDHNDLDTLHSEVLSARGGYFSLRERLDNTGTGSGDGGGVGVAAKPWSYRVTLEAGQLEVELPQTYVPNANAIQVFEGPLLLSEGKESDYEEIDNKHIKFNYDLSAGTEIRIVGSSSNNLYEWSFFMLSTDKQKEIHFADIYRPGFEDLQIYEDGMLLTPGNDYTEEDSRTVKFTIPLEDRSNISIFKRRV